MFDEPQAVHPDLRRILAKALMLAFSVAGFTAIAAILSGDFGDTEGRVIVVSLGFAVFSANSADVPPTTRARW